MAGVEREARQLTIGTDLAEDGAVHISVADGGTGIVPEMLEQIFEPLPYYQDSRPWAWPGCVPHDCDGARRQTVGYQQPGAGRNTSFHVARGKGARESPFCQSAVA